MMKPTKKQNDEPRVFVGSMMRPDMPGYTLAELEASAAQLHAVAATLPHRKRGPTLASIAKDAYGDKATAEPDNSPPKAEAIDVAKIYDRFNGRAGADNRREASKSSRA
jgi:hypothetical protein